MKRASPPAEMERQEKEYDSLISFEHDDNTSLDSSILGSVPERRRQIIIEETPSAFMVLTVLDSL